MLLTYLDYLFLESFSPFEPIKINTLYHIFTGKRTVSVMLQALRYGLAPYFGFFPKLNTLYFEKKINAYQKENLLLATETGYKKSEAAIQLCESHFSNHQKLTNPDQLRYALAVPLFKRQLLFLSQVLSEISHQNKQFTPRENRISEQNWLKKQLAIPGDRLSFAKEMGNEWLTVLDYSRVDEKELFLEQMEGYLKVQKTARQVAESYQLEEAEVLVMWQEGWLSILNYLEAEPAATPIFNRLYNDLISEGGLCSESVQETYRLWVKGMDEDRIANHRHLKISTINDHLTEMAIVYPKFPFNHFLSPEMLEYVETNKTKNDFLDYKHIQTIFPEVSFFENRLMQIRHELGGSKWKKN